jgi:hypothetical protein
MRKRPEANSSSGDRDSNAIPSPNRNARRAARVELPYEQDEEDALGLSEKTGHEANQPERATGEIPIVLDKGVLSLDPPKRPKGPRSYYGSVDGFKKPSSGKMFTPLLWRPTEVLANCQHLFWDSKLKTVKGHGWSVRLNQRWKELERSSQARGLTRHEVDALLGEDIRIYWSQQKTATGSPTRPAKRYFLRLRILEFMRSTFDSLFLPFQLYRKVNPNWKFDSNRYREAERMKVRIATSPAASAAAIKSWCGIARAWYFDDKSVPLPSFLKGMGNEFLLDFSYSGRALPPPPRDEDLLADYVSRLTSEPPPVNHDWERFLRQYFKRFPAKTCAFRTDPSVAASLGYTRKQGGFVKAVKDLVSLGIALMRLNEIGELPSDAQFLNTKEIWTGRKMELLLIPPSRNADGDIISCQRVGGRTLRGPRRIDQPKTDAKFESNRTWSKRMKPPSSIKEVATGFMADRGFAIALNVAVHFVLSKLDQIPLVPIYAEEKGLKVRYPATTMAAATLVYQLHRRAIDAHVMEDPRHSESLGGHKTYPAKQMRGHVHDGFYYSQDLSFATDLHPFWLTKGTYDVLGEESNLVEIRGLKLEYGEYYDKLFGPHKIITSQDELPPILVMDHLQATMPIWEMSSEEFTEYLKDFSLYNPEMILEDQKAHRPINFEVQDDNCRSLIQGYSDVIQHLNDLEMPITTTSASMGDATSFPVMPLLTSFACWRVDEELKQNHLDRHFTAGDDAVIPDMTARAEPLFERAMESCGAVLSRGDPKKNKPNKIYKHKYKFMFTEAVFVALPRRTSNPFRTGRPRLRPTIHMSLWSAPPGGSKGSIDWFNQASSVIQHYEDNQIPRNKMLWKYSSPYHSTAAAYKLGLPVGAPIGYGGLDNPYFPKRAGLRKQDTEFWLSALSQLDKFQLVTGTGMSPLPSGQSQLSMSLARDMVKGLEKEKVKVKNRGRLIPTKFPALVATPISSEDDSKQNVSLEEVADSLMRMTTSFEMYFRPAPQELHTPSIYRAAHKFLRRIRKPKVFLRHLDPDATFDDLALKAYHFVDHRHNWDLPPKTIRHYGLKSSGDTFQGKMNQRWEHLSEYRLDRAYLGVKSDSMRAKASFGLHSRFEPG